MLKAVRSAELLCMVGVRYVDAKGNYSDDQDGELKCKYEKKGLAWLGWIRKGKRCARGTWTRFLLCSLCSRSESRTSGGSGSRNWVCKESFCCGFWIQMTEEGKWRKKKSADTEVWYNIGRENGPSMMSRVRGRKRVVG